MKVIREALAAVTIALLSTHPVPAKPSNAAAIRLTPIAPGGSGSGCSLFLDRRQKVYVGSMDNERFGAWKVGLNDHVYLLTEFARRHSPEVVDMRSSDVRISLRSLGVVSSSRDPHFPHRLSKVSAHVVVGNHAQDLVAYEVCGDG